MIDIIIMIRHGMAQNNNAMATTICIKPHAFQFVYMATAVGLWELCRNNFGNFDNRCYSGWKNFNFASVIFRKIGKERAKC